MFAQDYIFEHLLGWFLWKVYKVTSWSMNLPPKEEYEEDDGRDYDEIDELIVDAFFMGDYGD